MRRKIENIKWVIIKSILVIKQALEKLKQENQDFISQKKLENELEALEAHI